MGGAVLGLHTRWMGEQREVGRSLINVDSRQLTMHVFGEN